LGIKLSKILYRHQSIDVKTSSKRLLFMLAPKKRTRMKTFNEETRPVTQALVVDDVSKP
jgi:hypothetical protein